MMNMETQLASLSSLVHSALMAKSASINDTVYKDLDAIRRDIIGTKDDVTSDNGSTSRFSDVNSERSNFHHTINNGNYFAYENIKHFNLLNMHFRRYLWKYSKFT